MLPIQSRPQATRYTAVSKNDIDFFVCPQEHINRDEIDRRLKTILLTSTSALTYYVHTPFCAESCVFCAFANANDRHFKRIPEYVDLLISNVRERVRQNERLAHHPITAIHCGGGSPDLLGRHIDPILSEFQLMPGYDLANTEISVEASPATVKKEFVDVLADHGVTKISVGVQTFDPSIAKSQKIVKGMPQILRLLDYIDGRIPIVNVDLMTGLPGQTIGMVENDIGRLMEERRITAITTYSLSANNSPPLIADILRGRLPSEPAATEHIMMRYHSLNLLYRNGWIRRGTHTYVRGSLPQAIINRVKGNESVARRRYQDALIAFGPSAVTSTAGLRMRQVNDLDAWCRSVAAGEEPIDLRNCSLEPLADLALWIFPLRFEGLTIDDYEDLIRRGIITDGQQATLEQLVAEGLVLRFERRFETSAIGEVFMGCLMQDLRQPHIREAVDHYVAAGEVAGVELARRG